jgi:hypothetical protein
VKSKTQAGVTTEIKSEIHAQTRIQSLQQIVQVHGYRRLRRTQQPVRQCMGLQGSYASLYPPPAPLQTRRGVPKTPGLTAVVLCRRLARDTTAGLDRRLSYLRGWRCGGNTGRRWRCCS